MLRSVARLFSRERELRGRVVLRAADAIVVELTTAEGVTWTLPANVTITWNDGTTETVRLDAARSTRPGPVPAGASIRLALEAHDPRAVTSLTFEVGSERWTVVF